MVSAISVIPGDAHYLALTFLITVFMQLSFFVVAYGFEFDLVTDFAGSTNFIILAVLTLILGGSYDSAVGLGVTIIFCVSRLWLALFLLGRVLIRGKDNRFDEVRNQFWVFLGFWVYQIFWVFVVSLPVIWINSSAAPLGSQLGAAEIIAFVLMALGTVLEVWADVTKYLFRADKANSGLACSWGPWYWSRHPNYFGEIIISLGAFIAGIPIFQTDPAGFATVLGPIYTIAVLLFLSGLPTGEGAAQARYYRDPEKGELYTKYRFRTSPVIPVPPQLYELLPRVVRQVFCCEFPMYEYVPEANAEGNGADKESAGGGRV